MRFAILLVAAACSTTPPQEADWLGQIADAKLLTELSIPGSHDSGAMYEPYPGIAQAQKLTIADQLAAGIRYFDIRCRDDDDQFLIYHGAIDQNQTFDDVLATMFAFLDAHPTEAVIASIKEEAAETGATIPFDQLFQRYVAMAPERWYLGKTIPALADARGKLVLLRRFDTTAAPLGIDASPWADNATFSIANGDQKLRIEDNYMVGDNATKWSEITALLDEAASGDATTQFLTYTSGYQTVMNLPDIVPVSDDIDARLDTWLANPRAHTGTLVMDFVTEARASAIIATNQ